MAAARRRCNLLKRLAQPLEALLPLDPTGLWAFSGGRRPLIIAFLIFVCFLGGLLARSCRDPGPVKKAESGVLWRIPGYGFIKALTDSLDKRAAESALRPVLIHFDDSAQLGFEVDHLAATGVASSTCRARRIPRAGAVMVMDAARVEAVPMSFIVALRDLPLGRARAGADPAGPALAKGSVT